MVKLRLSDSAKRSGRIRTDDNSSVWQHVVYSNSQKIGVKCATGRNPRDRSLKDRES